MSAFDECVAAYCGAWGGSMTRDLFDQPRRTSPVTQEELDDCYGGSRGNIEARGCACDRERLTQENRVAGGQPHLSASVGRRSWPLDDEVCTGLDVPSDPWTSEDVAYWTGTPRYQPWKDVAAFFRRDG